MSNRRVTLGVRRAKRAGCRGWGWLVRNAERSEVIPGGLTTLVCLALAGCGPGGRHNGGDDTGNCPGMCTGLGYQACIDGVLQTPVQCEVGQVCDPNLGCTVCVPN